MIIKTLDKYDKETAERIRALLIQLSRSGKDRGEIPEEWFNDLINSDYHDMLIAIDDTKTNDNQVSPIVGIATLSIIMGPIVRKVAYLEDFVTDESYRGKGVGSALWDAILEWSKQKGCTELTFTSGQGREAAQKFYQNRGATIYDTNFFRLPL
jgi:GNAT superfamily N-acetyltransferase